MPQDVVLVNPGKICTKARQAAGKCITVKQKMLKRKWLKHERAEARRHAKAMASEAADVSKFNPRGIPWSGCVARPRRRKGGKRVRLVRYGPGRSPSAFAFSSLIGRTAAKRLLKACRRAKRGGCKSAMGRSLRKCRGRGGKRGGVKCFTARGKRVCFRVRK